MQISCRQIACDQVFRELDAYAYMNVHNLHIYSKIVLRASGASRASRTFLGFNMLFKLLLLRETGSQQNMM